MPRIRRLLVRGKEAVYHVISRTALEGFVLGEVEKEYLLNLIKHLSSVYFTDVLGFVIMGNHFHLLVRMKTSDSYSDEEVRERVRVYYGNKREISDGQIPFFREKLSNLSEYVKDIKQRFSRYYNKRHGRKGYFWGERFKSVIVEKGETLINCLAYIDLNPIRANLVERPEDYRWSSIGYHIQSGNQEEFLSTDFGLSEFGEMSSEQRLWMYREFLYKKGGISIDKGKIISQEVIERECRKDFRISQTDRFRYRCRYFTESGIIGTKAFVTRYYELFKDYFGSKKKKKPKPIAGLAKIYSLKRLSEAIK